MTESLKTLEALLLGWFIAAPFPIVAAVISALIRTPRKRALPSAIDAVVRLYGWTLLFVLCVALPFMGFAIYVAPAMFERYPWTQLALGWLTAFANYIASYMFILVPVLWPAWVLLYLIFRVRGTTDQR